MLTLTQARAQAVAAPATTGIRGRLFAVYAALGRVPASVFPLLFRLGIASVFVKAGLNKLASWEVTVQLFQDEYRVPFLAPATAATMATTFELGCSLLLVLGLLARVATLPLFGMLAVIQLFVYPDAWSEHLVWGSMLAFLLTRGPGAISVDRLLGLEPDRPRG